MKTLKQSLKTSMNDKFTVFIEFIKEKARSLLTYMKGQEFRSNVLFILFLVLIRLFVLGNYTVPTGSMNPTILEGDKFFSNKLSYSLKIPFTKFHPLRWSIPKRGDIIAFIYPVDEKFDYTKRVIGLPGDKITVEGRDLYINDTLIEKVKIKEDPEFVFYEENLNGVKHIIQHHKNMFGAKEDYYVPENALFVMGDNRDNSWDSRNWDSVPMENVTGKLIFRWMSNIPGKPWLLRLNRIGLIK